MNATMFLQPAPYFYTALDRGVSDEARRLRGVDEIGNHSKSLSLELERQVILAHLLHAYCNSIMHAAQGDQVRTGDISAYLYASEFLSRLPASIPHPDIAVDNDGDIAIEWDFGPRRLISIRVARDGSISYAWLVGYAAFHGTETLRDAIPELVLYGIERVVNDATE